jgi:hypothetical protein
MVAAALLAAGVAAASAVLYLGNTSSPWAPATVAGQLGSRSDRQLEQWLVHHGVYRAEREWLVGHRADQDRRWASHHTTYRNELAWLRQHLSDGRGRSLGERGVMRAIHRHNQWLVHQRAYEARRDWLLEHPQSPDREWRGHYSAYHRELSWLRRHRADGHARSLGDYRVDGSRLERATSHHRSWVTRRTDDTSHPDGSERPGHDRTERETHRFERDDQHD